VTGRVTLSEPLDVAALGVRTELACEACGYGIVVARPPARCPMCQGTAWELVRDSDPAAAEEPIAAPIEIGSPTETDLKQLYGLAKTAFDELPGWDDERVLEVLRGDLVFVARRRAQPAGYVALRHDPPSASVVVDQLLVAPGHEHAGVGHRLLAYAEGYAIATRAQTLRVVAEEGNWRARSFYMRSGFMPVEAELLELVLPQPV
jgi:ribosomal protein S18 acetylase RimI-like enzyme